MKFNKFPLPVVPQEIALKLKQNLKKVYKHKADRNKKGVYAIKIENWIYVGSVNNKSGFGRHFKKHLSDLEKLNSLYPEKIYLEKIVDYNKKFLFKIFVGLATKGYEISDLKFYLLDARDEIYEEWQIQKIEKYWIEQFQSNYYGFNEPFLTTFYIENNMQIYELINILNKNLPLITKIKKDFFDSIDQALIFFDWIKENPKLLKYFWISFNFLNLWIFSHDII
ncbi:hypothetical protein ACW95P_03330 [Candidatus Mycoplasma pogonae]